MQVYNWQLSVRTSTNIVNEYSHCDDNYMQAWKCIACFASHRTPHPRTFPPLVECLWYSAKATKYKNLPLVKCIW